jgi:hypothetical protein
MSEPGSSMHDLPSALRDSEAVNERPAGRHPDVERFFRALAR